MNDPETIDRYEIRGILGHGAMGNVYRAWDPKLHREVAMKVVAQTLSRDAKGRQRFHREARAIAALRHSNIVEIYDYSGVESEHLYLVMEKLEGDDLFNIMNSKGMMPEPAAAAVGHELCAALQVAHEAGVIHRDLKPENVFMDGQGRVVLTDFGVVKAIREDSAVDGWQADTDVIGTPGFMAPELMMNRALGPRTDIFALGALLYNIATGELPYEGDSPVEMFRNVVSGKIRDPRQYNPGLSQEFVDLLGECLQAKPKKRFRSVEMVRERLKLVLEHNGVSDLRDDLRDYMRDPKAYAQLARRRVVSYLTARLKVAIKDHDEQSAIALRARLLEVDPENDEVHAISGVTSPQMKAIRNNTEMLSRGQNRAGGWLYAVVGVLAGLAVLLAGYLVFQPRPLTENKKPDQTTKTHTRPDDEDEDDGPQKPDQPQVGSKQPGEKLEPGNIDILIRGGRGVLTVDGKKYGKVTRKSLKLTPGKHVIEIKGSGKRLKQTVDVSSSGATLTVDISRGRITRE